MSSPRMCDSTPYCVNDPTGSEPWKRLFSELDDGWATGNVNLTKRDKKTGAMTHQTVSQDTCPACTDLKLGITRAASADDVEAAKAAKLDPRYVDWLERQNQVGPYSITDGASSG